MTAYEADRMELEIKYCKKLERTLADLRQELENLRRVAQEKRERRKRERGRRGCCSGCLRTRW